jgi:sialic acid synthase SpsE
MTIRIGNKVLGEKVYIIAEAGVNHGNDLDTAKRLILEASQAGADAIKFQTYTADELVCKGAPKFWNYEGDKDKLTQHDAYSTIGGFPYGWYPELIAYCKELGIEFLSTPFSFEAADKLNEMGMAAFKVASSDMSHIPFLKHIAKFGKPILLSTGASRMDEIIEAVDAIIEAGNDQIVVMHCILNYPTKEKDANLNIIRTLKKTFPDLEVGFSDHTLGLEAPTVASALGATLIEKHFTHDKTLTNTADHWLSVDPKGLKDLIRMTNNAKEMLGASKREVFECEKTTRKYDKRSIVSRVAIPKDTLITEDMITYKRPGTGLWPTHVDMVVGSIAQQDIPADTPINFDMV